MTEKTRLSDKLDKTASWVWIEDAHLKVEFYDFSELAQTMFGNDIAYTITVKDMHKLFSLSEQDLTSLIPWMKENFESYFGIKRWLEENGIDFSVEVESWA